MAHKKVLVQRYDNEKDILAIEGKGYSDVYQRSRDEDFEVVVVVPTKKASTDICVVADAISKQYTPSSGTPWPGKPDKYPVRVDVQNVRYTSVDKVKAALEKAEKNWKAAWTIMTVRLDEEDLF